MSVMKSKKKNKTLVVNHILNQLNSSENFEMEKINLKDIELFKLFDKNENLKDVDNILKKEKKEKKNGNKPLENTNLKDNYTENDKNKNKNKEKNKYKNKNKKTNVYEECKKIGINQRFISSIKTLNFDEIQSLINNTNVKYLIDINSNQYDEYNEYPIIIAYKNCIGSEFIKNRINENTINIFSSLLKLGADINIKGRNNQTILEDSLINKHYIITKIIFNHLIEKHISKNEDEDEDENENENENENKNENEFINSNKSHELTILIDDDTNNNYIVIDDDDNNKYTDNNYIVIDDDDEYTDNKYTDNKYTDNKYTDNKYADNKYTDNDGYIVIDDDDGNHDTEFNLGPNNKRKLIENHEYNGRNKKSKTRNCDEDENILDFINIKFDSIVRSYLFEKNFDVKTLINNTNVNNQDCYNNTIFYYALLKKDSDTIKYLIDIDPECYIDIFDFIFCKLGFSYFSSIFCDLLEFESVVSHFISDEFQYTKVFENIIKIKNISLDDKKCMMKKLYEVCEFIFTENLIKIALLMPDKKESEDLILFLLNELNIKIDDNNENVLVYAVNMKLYDLINIFFENKDKYFRDFNTSIYSAYLKAIDNQEQMALKIFQTYINEELKSFKINSKVEYPLVHAVQSNNVGILLYLIDKGANITDSYIYNNMSVLYYALTLNHPNVKIIECLIKRGAKMNIFNLEEFQNLFKILKDKNNLNILKSFFNYRVDNFINNMLKYAIKLNRLDILKIMVESKLNLETKVRDDESQTDVTLWKYASIIKNVKICNFLKNARDTRTEQNRQKRMENIRNYQKKQQKRLKSKR